MATWIMDSKGNNISNLAILEGDTNEMPVLWPHYEFCQGDRQGVWHRSTGVQMLFLRLDIPRTPA